MEALLAVAQHLPQHAKHVNHGDQGSEAVEGAAAHQAMALGGTDGNGDWHRQNTFGEGLRLAQNLVRSHYHSAWEVATFGRNPQNHILAGDIIYLLRNQSRRQVDNREVDCGHGPGSGRAADRPPQKPFLAAVEAQSRTDRTVAPRPGASACEAPPSRGDRRNAGRAAQEVEGPTSAAVGAAGGSRMGRGSAGEGVAAAGGRRGRDAAGEAAVGRRGSDARNRPGRNRRRRPQGSANDGPCGAVLVWGFGIWVLAEGGDGAMFREASRTSSGSGRKGHTETRHGALRQGRPAASLGRVVFSCPVSKTPIYILSLSNSKRIILISYLLEESLLHLTLKVIKPTISLFELFRRVIGSYILIFNLSILVSKLINIETLKRKRQTKGLHSGSGFF
jgi:hypothetical protein